MRSLEVPYLKWLSTLDLRVWVRIFPYWASERCPGSATPFYCGLKGTVNWLTILFSWSKMSKGPKTNLRALSLRMAFILRQSWLSALFLNWVADISRHPVFRHQAASVSSSYSGHGILVSLSPLQNKRAMFPTPSHVGVPNGSWRISIKDYVIPRSGPTPLLASAPPFKIVYLLIFLYRN